jgi:HD-like signal output (HDOD) protein
MTSKSILLAVADPQVLIDTTQALGAGWEATSVANEADALAQFEKRSFDALLVDFNLSSPDASDLLNQALEKHPKTIRFLYAYEADLALVAAKVLGTPNILPKPFEPGLVKIRIEKGVKDANSQQNGSEPAPAPKPDEPPKIPAIYSEVLKAIESPGVTNEQLGEIIARDAALTSELFRINNPSYLGLPRDITRPVEAVESLGFEAVKGIVMALQFLAEHKRLKPGYVSLDQIWQHSINVGQIARDLVFFETKDRVLASQALLAGLLHDLGKVVLAKNFEDLYGRVHSLARKQPVALWDVEKEMFGANHGEIGGCLVGMWSMPSAIVEATAFHHEPPLGEQQQLTPLAAIHVANVLEHELWPGDEGMMVRPIINTPFLNEVGLLQRLPVWRAALANRRFVEPEPEAASDETEQSVSTVRSGTSARPRGGVATSPVPTGRFRSSWVWAGAAAILMLLILWIRTEREVSQIKQAYARTPAPQQAPAVVSATPAPAPVAVAPPQVAPVTPAVAAVEQPPASPATSETVTKPQASPSVPEPTPAAAPATIATNVQPVSAPPPKKRAPDDFRLSGIIYIGANPSAIVNGRRVSVGDWVDGATVVGIGRTTVVLDINGKRRAFELR